jgi:sugar phosphate isomerase/epimerase
MEVRGIGIDINDGRVNGDLELLQRELDYFQLCGFDVVELTTSGLFFIFNGMLHMGRAQAIDRILRRYPFHYTLHLPDRLNLGGPADPGLEKSVFRSCIEFAGLVGAVILVYHSGQDYLDVASEHDRKKALELETAALAEMSEKARSAGITVTVENQNPHPGEAEFLAERGISGEQLRLLHPGLFPAAIGRQIEKINSPNLGMTLDPGHLFLAVELTGEDFLASVEGQAKHIKHLHLNDNFGKNPSAPYSRMEQPLFGLGDCHLPLGMGTMPIQKCLNRLAGYSGYVIFEMRPEYRNHLPESIEVLKRLVQVEQRDN